MLQRGGCTLPVPKADSGDDDDGGEAADDDGDSANADEKQANTVIDVKHKAATANTASDATKAKVAAERAVKATHAKLQAKARLQIKANAKTKLKQAKAAAVATAKAKAKATMQARARAQTKAKQEALPKGHHIRAPERRREAASSTLKHALATIIGHAMSHNVQQPETPEMNAPKVQSAAGGAHATIPADIFGNGLKSHADITRHTTSKNESAWAMAWGGALCLSAILWKLCLGQDAKGGGAHYSLLVADDGMEMSEPIRSQHSKMPGYQAHKMAQGKGNVDVRGDSTEDEDDDDLIENVPSV